MTEIHAPFRLATIDIARGLAVLGMFGYHLTWDLAHFGFIHAGAPFAPTFRLYSHLVATMFLFLAGASLVLARRTPFRWDRWGRHLLVISVAAVIVTLASAILFPEGLIGFGILHCIAAAILLATPLLFLPPLVLLVAVVVVAALPAIVASETFNAPALVWTGLGTVVPQSNDFRPFFPWAAPVFAGVAAMSFAATRGLVRALEGWRPHGQVWSLLAFGGRHSLAIYLLHQPIFFGVLAAAAAVASPARVTAELAFTQPCERECLVSGAPAGTCSRICACVARDLRGLNLLDRATANRLDTAEALILSRLTQQCLRQTR